MARTPKPWWWEERQSYYVNIKGQKHRLDPNKKTADKLFHALMANVDDVPTRSDRLLVFDVIKRVIDWVEKNRSAGTHSAYKQRCQWFLDEVKGLAVDDLTPEVVEKWVNKPTWSDGMRWTCIGTLKTVFRRAVRMKIIPESPIRDMERPSPGRREHFITADEHTKVMGLINDAPFRELLTVVWECGPRPQEILRVTAAEVDTVNGRWIFSVKRSKGKKRMRVVNLTENSLEICKRLCQQFPSGPIFRNLEGAPWTPESVNCQFVRLHHRMGRLVLDENKLTVNDADIKRLIPTLKKMKNVAGIEREKSKAELQREAKVKLTNRLASTHAVKLCLYLYRHSWMTRMLLGGNDPITVAAMGGHSDPSTLAKVYQHVLSDTEHVKKALAKIQ